MTNPKQTTDLVKENVELKRWLRSFIKHATPEEGQSWGFDFIVSEESYDKLQELLK